MRYLLLPSLLLAFGLVTAFAPSEPASFGAETVDIDGLEITIQYEADEPSESRGNAATVTISALDASTPIPEFIMFETRPRPGTRGAIALKQGDDGTYSGTGQIAAPGKIQSITLGYTEVEWTYIMRGGLRDGSADVDLGMRPEGAQAKRGKGKVTVKVRCCPLEVVIRTGAVDVDMAGTR